MKYYTLENKTPNKGKYSQIADGELIEKKSKFYSYIFKIQNEEEALQYVDNIRKDNLDARHVVYIYSVLDEENNKKIRFSDDGEPQGTGTKAIYELIEKESITNICIVIVRYFGGILLGAGPLSRAYLNTAREALDKCSKKEIYNYICKKVILTYNGYNIFKNRTENYIKSEELIISSCNFNEEVEIELLVVDFELENIEKIIEEINYGS